LLAQQTVVPTAGTKTAAKATKKIDKKLDKTLTKNGPGVTPLVT